MYSLKRKFVLENTIRKHFGLSIGENSVHGSDAPESAEYEIKQLFSVQELLEAQV